MLNLIMKEMKDFYSYKNKVFLLRTADVEKKFVEVLNLHKDAFWDEKSLELMKNIDTAKRQGDYGVVTNIGESCITCLSTGCKFGLLVLYYQKYPKVKILVREYVLGRNVWRCLAEHGDFTFYLEQEQVDDLLNVDGEYQLWYKGNSYDCHDKFKIWDICTKAVYGMTKESEKKAYESFSSNREQTVFCNLKEEMSLTEFSKRFPEYENILSYLSVENTRQFNYNEYKVINYCSEIPQRFIWRRLPLYVCGKRGDTWECRKINSLKYPEFLELLYWDVLDGEYFVRNSHSDKRYFFFSEYETWFVLLLDGEEVCPIHKYPEYIILGIEVEKEKKEIRIINKNQALERFHTLYEGIGYTLDDV